MGWGYLVEDNFFCCVRESLCYSPSLGTDIINAAWDPLVEDDERTENCLSVASSFCSIVEKLVGKLVVQSAGFFVCFFWL